MKAIAELKHGLGEGWRSLAEGWDNVRQRAGHAMTRFRRDRDETVLGPEDDDFLLSSPRWGLVAGEVFEDRDKVVVRVEAPGMDVRDFQVEAVGGALRLRGAKRSTRESGEGAWRMTECAYDSFERTFPLPAEVNADRAKATYRRGVLRIELPKAERRLPRQVKVKVQ